MSLEGNQRPVNSGRRELELPRVADAAGDPLEAIRHCHRASERARYVTSVLEIDRE
jgi:hypothetical protein